MYILLCVVLFMGNNIYIWRGLWDIQDLVETNNIILKTATGSILTMHYQKKGFRKEKGSFKKFLRLQNQHSSIIIIGGKYFVLQFVFFYWILLCKCILKILKITKYMFGVLFEKIVLWFASMSKYNGIHISTTYLN